MPKTYLTSSILAVTALSLAACSGSATADNETTPMAAAQTVADTAQTLEPGADISAIPSGTYTLDKSHAYVAFSYSHRGLSNPILQWRNFDATVVLDSANPENSTLDVTIATNSIDSGVTEWDEKLLKADWFDAATYPTITFKSTELNQVVQGRGTLTGDLTVKGVTAPLTLDVTLNGTGESFGSKKPVFGISAKGSMKRGDFGVDTYLPSANDIELMIEVEFIKTDD